MGLSLAAGKKGSHPKAACVVRNASNIWGEQMKGPGAYVAEAEIKPHLCC